MHDNAHKKSIIASLLPDWQDTFCKIITFDHKNKLVVYEIDSHNLAVHRKAKRQEIIAWFDRYLTY